jgi:plasmid stabilization system protein ParE
MKDPLPLEVTALAARQIRDAENWWRENRRAAPDAVHEELERAFSLITAQPGAGGRASDVDLPGVRRVSLPKIKYQLYYRVLPDPERVQVVALWHTRRGRPPRL